MAKTVPSCVFTLSQNLIISVITSPCVKEKTKMVKLLVNNKTLKVL